MKEFPAHPLRTRFAKDILCEFLPPLKTSNKVLILCSGMPGYPGGKGEAMQTLARRGYWVFVPRYRGSWESGGTFLQRSPHEDILAVVQGLSKPFIDFYSEEKMRVTRPQITVIGASFGGPAAILASRDTRVKQAIALSPVIDWRGQRGTAESLEMMEAFLPKAFGEAYRGDPEKVWKKLASGRFYNPVHEVKTIQGKKLLIMHAKDDHVVPFAPAQEFAEAVDARFEAIVRGGHFGVSSILKPHLWRRASSFLTKY